MEREIIAKLLEWKENPRRKPLVLTGARQVGKTWALKEFGKRYFEKVAYVNFEDMEQIRNIFVMDFDMDRILISLNVAVGINISEGNTLLILDEIQSAEKGVTALKYFCEKKTNLHVAAAGSLLGVELHRHTSYPVGKVDQMFMYPMTFNEFLYAVGDEALVKLLETSQWEVANMCSDRFKERLKQYYYVGGMPEAVAEFVENKDFKSVRKIQNNILLAYQRDFSKHAPAEIVPRIIAVWDSLPKQLSHENKKFIYGAVRESARAKDYELALQWLNDCGLCHQVHGISAPNYPLKAAENREMFKLFCVDVGLLGALSGVSAISLLNGNELFTDFKGALTEQFVCQQIISFSGLHPCYWSSATGKGEVDFVVQVDDNVIPIEVKAEENLQAKSLKVYVEKYSPKIALRTSMSNYRTEPWLVNVPLFAIGSFLKSMVRY